MTEEKWKEEVDEALKELYDRLDKVERRIAELEKMVERIRWSL